MDNENYTYGFEKLDVWKNARELNKKVYLITNAFPSEERFGLISQIRRASVSISSNIAEGSSRFHTKDQSRFYQIAFGSAVEVLNQLILAHDLGFLDIDKLIEIRKQISDITYKLGGLIKNLDYKNSIK
ncbi:MAG: four helix bundle protein [Saprospiraceae bacterium]|jgi:four helix bundle protein|nr:four helix bundle protein [Saprospiraceae bacterium]